jgi:HK97 family phage major capsid protein
MEKALADVEASDGNSAAQRVFDQALAEHKAARSRLEGAEAVEEAKRGLPVALHEEGEPEHGGSRGRGKARASWNARTEHVGGEPATYQTGCEYSFMKDQLAAKKGNREALERIVKSYRELADTGHLKLRRGEKFEERAIAETAGAGGELVAPLYLQEEYLKLARAARPYWDLLTRRPLPPNTNSINIPKLVSGTRVGAQADLGAVESHDLVTGLLTFPVITIAGQQDFARQLFDRAVPELADLVVFPDLVADYLTKTDIQALSGSGVSPNAKGVFESVEAGQKVTYTTGEPKLTTLYSKVADAIQRVHTKRFMPPNAIVMHPRRWGWCLAAVDSQNRPLIVPSAGGPMNVIGNLENVASEAIVGSMQGLPVIVDPSIPTNLGAKTNQDAIIIQRVDDSWAMEDDPIKTKVYEEVLSDELAVRCQVFNYASVTHERYKQSIATIEGTGLETPVF